jgi:hypothetical protein
MLVEIYQTYVDWALTAMQRSQYGLAARYAEQALVVLGRDPAWFGVPQAEVAHLYFIQGEALAKHGQPAGARSAFFRTLSLDPDHEDAQLALNQLDSTPVTRPTPEPPVETHQVSPPEPVGDSISGIPQVLDTGLLRINRVMIPLYGVKGEHGQYVTDLEAYIRDREVSCSRQEGDSFRCTLGEADLSETVILNGAGSALPGAPENLQGAEQQARQNKVGVWE